MIEYHFWLSKNMGLLLVGVIGEMVDDFEQRVRALDVLMNENWLQKIYSVLLFLQLDTLCLCLHSFEPANYLHAR